MSSKNGGYTGGMMTTPSPGSMSARRASTITTLTSVVLLTRVGSTCHCHWSRANPAKAPAMAPPSSPI